MRLSGRILDFGGGEVSNYSEKMAGWLDQQQAWELESANIDPLTQPTYLLDESGQIPVAAERYGWVLALNTFEHIYRLRETLLEIRRVLQPNGIIVFIVPFIFRVHAHPDDYLRGTPSYWARLLDELGFSAHHIEALTWGPFSTALSVSGVIGPMKRLRFLLALHLDLAYFRMRHPDGGDLLEKDQESPIVSTALGYFISATKSI